MTRNKTVKIRMTPQMYEALRRIAAGGNGLDSRGISDVIRQAIVAYVAGQPVGGTGREDEEAARVD